MNPAKVKLDTLSELGKSPDDCEPEFIDYSESTCLVFPMRHAHSGMKVLVNGGLNLSVWMDGRMKHEILKCSY